MPSLPTNPITDIIDGGKNIIDNGKDFIDQGIQVGKDIIDTGKETVTNIGSFVSDPAGYIFDLLKTGAKGLANDVLPALAHATEPDLAAEWFLNAYKISFATAIFVWVFLLAFQIYKVAQGSLSTRDLSEALGPQTIQFFAGAIYGPTIGWLTVKFFSALGDVFIGWGITSSADTTVASFTKMIDDANVGAIVGGVFVGILLMFFMILALIMTLGILIVTLVALYFTGVIFPLGWVWIVSKGHRRHGRRIAVLWVGILAMHALLFFFLGFTFTLMANAVLFGEWSDGLKTLVQLLVAIVAMIGAGIAPYKLMKFAMVVPEGAGGQDGGQISASGGGGGNSYGADGPSSARDVARNSGGQSDSSPGGGNAGGKGAEMSWAEPTSERKPLSNALSAMKESGGGSEAGGGASAAGGKVPTPGAGAGAGAGPGPGAAGTVGSGAAGAGAGAGAAGAGAGGAAAGAEGLAAAGAAESSTGVGALVGVPTMIAAAGVAAGQKAVEASDIALDQAVGELNDSSEGYANE